MKYLSLLKGLTWHYVAAAVITVGILHICAVFAAPELATGTAYQRLAATLPVNKMVLLPPITPSAQPLPFLTADGRYAMCRFETSKGPVAITAALPERGWTLALHSPDGENFYTATAQPGSRTEISLLLVPTEERFLDLGLELGTGSQQPQQQPEGEALKLSAREGVVVLRAPDRGIAYRPRMEGLLKRAECMQKSF